MKIGETISTVPVSTEKSVRADEVRALTSCRAGKIVPVAFIPLLREDRVSRGSVKVSFDMSETVYSLMNAINVTVMAHFIPFSAFERFPGMDSFNRSYQGIGEPHNDLPIPFFTTVNFDRDAAFWKTLGVHWKQGEPINDAPLEAYNLLVNWRRRARSEKLPQRLLSNSALAQAFWKNPNLWHIVPDFDQAAIDGEVELQFANSRVPVRSKDWSQGNILRQAVSPAEAVRMPAVSVSSGTGAPFELPDGDFGWGQQIYAELRDSGVTLSLANIELAKKTAAFARMREAYSGLEDDHIIDLLMEGIRVPDEALKQPMLLDKKTTIFGYSERHAMDGENLDKSVTTGATEVTLTFRTPPMNTGGIILITTEIVPEQLFERMRDNFLGATDPTTHLPNFMRDYLDPEKVDVVKNNFVDVEHATPNATFGYAPLNHDWKRSITRIGGKYYRPNPDAFVEDRQRFWSVEQLNPTLTEDFYMVPEVLPHTVFADNLADPFEVLALGRVEIVGNTVFGKLLSEDRNDYEEIMDQVDTDRIVQGA